MTRKHTERWPFRQSDTEWGGDLMWDRKKVMEVHRRYNPTSPTRPADLLSPHQDGNNISNEGCLITCLAMVLRMLDTRGARWTPRAVVQESA